MPKDASFRSLDSATTLSLSTRGRAGWAPQPFSRVGIPIPPRTWNGCQCNTTTNTVRMVARAESAAATGQTRLLSTHAVRRSLSRPLASLDTRTPRVCVLGGTRFSARRLSRYHIIACHEHVCSREPRWRRRCDRPILHGSAADPPRARRGHHAGKWLGSEWHASVVVAKGDGPLPPDHVDNRKHRRCWRQ